MVIAPLQSTTPVLATTINPLTDQVARDDRAREKIVAVVVSCAATAENGLSAEEPQRKKASWPPRERPEAMPSCEPRSWGNMLSS